MLSSLPPLLIYVATALALAAAIRFGGAALLRRLRFRQLETRYGAEMAQTILERRIAQGMSPEMVVEAWGKPAGMEETVLKTKVKREMKYDPKGKNRYGTRVWFENDVVVGWETK